MRHYIDVVRRLTEDVLLEMSTPTTQRFIEIAYDRMAHLPAEIIVALKDTNIAGFADLANMVEISDIETPDELRDRGYASQALTILTEIADEMGVTLVLTVALSDDDKEWPMSFEDLSYWYERHGFEGDRKMIRFPRQANNGQDANPER